MSTGTRKRYILGLHIEGVGRDVSLEKGAVWSAGPRSSFDEISGSDYEWVEQSISQIPRSKGASVDRFEGTIDASAMSVSMHAHDHVAETFLYAPSDPISNLGDDISDSDEDGIDIGVGGLDDTVVHIGAEAILLGDETSESGVYDNCTRGFWDSEAVAHDGPDGDVPGQNVYDDPPFWRHRRVKILQYDPDDQTTSIQWRGSLDAIETSENGTEVLFRCTGHLSIWKNVTVNRGASSIEGDLSVEFSGNDTVPKIRLRDYRTQVRNPDDTTSGWFDDQRPVWLQVGDGVMYVDLYGSLPRNWDDWRFFGQELGFEEGDEVGDIYELFVVSKKWDQYLQREYERGSRLDGPVSSTADFLYTFNGEEHWCYHPYAIGAALLLSSGRLRGDDFKVLSEQWGLDLDWLITDKTALYDAIQSRPNLQIDHLVLGWDGEPVDVLETVIYKLWLPYGFMPSISTSHLLTMRPFGMMGVEEFDEAQDNEITPLRGRLQQQPSLKSAVDGITATLDDLPFRDGINVEVTSRGDSPRKGLFSDSKEYEYDFGTLSYQSRADAIDILTNISALAHLVQPKIWIRVHHPELTGANLTLGEYVTLSKAPGRDEWFVGPDGARTRDMAGTLVWSGPVVGRKANLRSQTVDVQIELSNFRIGQVPRWRAPSMVVTDYSTDPNRVYCEDDPEFGFLDDSRDPAPDSESFTPGDDVLLWSRDGQPTDLDVIVSDVGEDGTGHYLEFEQDPANTPSVGDIITIDAYDDYANSSIFSNVARAYAYFADGTPALGADDDDADVYGQEPHTGQSLDDLDGEWVGEKFVGLDSDLFAPDHPVSTYAEHALRGNEMWMAKRGSRFTTTRLAAQTHESEPASAMRRVTSLTDSWFECGFVEIEPGLRQITIDIYGTVWNDGDESETEVYFPIRLVSTDLDVRTTPPDTGASPNTEPFSSYSNTLDIPPIESAQFARLLIGVRSLGGDFVEGWGNSPIILKHQLKNLSYSTEAISIRGDAPVLEITKYAEDSDDDPAPAMISTDGRKHDSTDPETRVFDESYAAIRSVHIEFDYKGGAPDLSEYGSETIRAKKTVAAETSSLLHRKNNHYLHERPRVLAMGTGSYLPGGEWQDTESEREHVAQHPYMRDDDGESTIYLQSILPKTASPQIDVHCELMGTLVTTGVGTSDVEKLLGDAAVAEWKFTVEALQLQSGGGWDQAAVISDDEFALDYQHIPTTWSPAFPFLQTRHWFYFDDEFNNFAAFCYREGQLYDRDLDVLPGPLSVSLELDEDDYDATRPIQVRVQAEFLNILDRGILSGPGNGRFEIVLVGASIIEKPT